MLGLLVPGVLMGASASDAPAQNPAFLPLVGVGQ